MITAVTNTTAVLKLNPEKSQFLVPRLTNRKRPISMSNFFLGNRVGSCNLEQNKGNCIEVEGLVYAMSVTCNNN